MMIGKAGPAKTAISTADASGVEIRGRDLCEELMGKLGFTEFFFLLVTGRQPTENQSFFLDLLLLSIAEHGLTPSVQAARMTLAAAPEALQGAVAAGVLGCGSVVLGAAEECATLLVEAQKRVEAGATPADAAMAVAREAHEAGRRLPGFGHPLHKPVDPRTEKIIALAHERGAGGPHLALAERLPAAVSAAWGKALPMNVSMAIAAVLLDLEFPPAMAKAVPILARTAGLLAHLAEEQETPIGFLMASKGAAAISYAKGDEADA